VDTHKERIETLCRYAANKLQGTGALLTDGGDKRSILFGSFPQAWKIRFIRSGIVVTSCEDSEITNFMKISEGLADADEATKKGVVPIVSEVQQVTTTSNGTFDTSRSVWLEEIRLPEFANNRCI